MPFWGRKRQSVVIAFVAICFLCAALRDSALSIFAPILKLLSRCSPDGTLKAKLNSWQGRVGQKNSDLSGGSVGEQLYK
jgi:hypothetical protein